MKVLTIYAHHNPHSFCHAVLEQFCAGLKDGGHSNEVVDLYAIGFNPVFDERDGPNWVDDSVPDDVLAHLDIENSIMKAAGRNPVRWFMARRWLAGLDARGIIRKIRARGGPQDVAIQQQKVASADALAFISPVYFVGFPAILKGWVERVFTLGFAFKLQPEAWRGEVRGRLPLLNHKKALIINTTIFDEASYRDGIGAAMKTLIDEFALTYPGIKKVQHEYFYAVQGADAAQRKTYLARAYALGKDFGAGEN